MERHGVCATAPASPYLNSLLNVRSWHIASVRADALIWSLLEIQRTSRQLTGRVSPPLFDPGCVEDHAMSLVRNGYALSPRREFLGALFSALLALALFDPGVVTAQEGKE